VTVDKELFADTLPTYLTRFVGRDWEIATVLSMLHPGQLVTVCGVGGAGKTRLAIEVAKRCRARPASFEAYEAGRKLNSEQAMRLADEALSALEEDLQRRSSGLTDREIEVLHLVADGLSNAEIAERLVLSERTVHAHLRSIFDKLGVNSRTAAAHAVASLFASR
jgi:ATP/maltotriose-dependent transcriptional regulator MalT